MKIILSILSWIGLALTLIPSILLLKGSLEASQLATLMTTGMVLWFVTRTLRETLFRPTEVSTHAVEHDTPHTL
jgi:membrane protein implicated in regulation of membrane protease activity